MKPYKLHVHYKQLPSDKLPYKLSLLLLVILLLLFYFIFIIICILLLLLLLLSLLLLFEADLKLQNILICKYFLNRCYMLFI